MTRTNESCRLAALFYPDRKWRELPRRGRGVNNTTRFLEGDGEPYTLRVYETHRDEARVAAEHAALDALAARDKPFRTPVPARTPDGRSWVRTEDGKLAALFPYIDGEHPALTDDRQLRDFGAKIAALSAALADVRLPVEPAYRPYYEIERTHPCAPPDAVRAFCASPPPAFASAAGALRLIAARYDAFLARRDFLESLPHQLVHGDLNASNALIDEAGAIAAVLDFEFATVDLRAMELAVCLSDLIDPEADEREAMRRADALLQGYGGAARLSAEEIEAIPLLLELRRLDVFVHFLGRYRDGVDDAADLARHTGSTARGLAWLADRAGPLAALLRARLG